MKYDKIISKMQKDMEKVKEKRLKELEEKLTKDFKKIRNKYHRLLMFDKRQRENEDKSRKKNS